MELSEIVNNMNSAKVAVLGDFNIDALVYGRHGPPSRESPAPILSTNKIEYCPGGAANVAANLMSLGIKHLAPISTVGNHVYGFVNLTVGDALLRYFEDVDCRGLIKTERPTYTYLKMMAKGQGTSTSHQQWYRVDLGSKEPINKQVEEEIISKMKLIEKDVGAIIVSDYEKGMVTQNIIKAVREIFRDKKKFATSRNRATEFKGFDVLVLNDYETAKHYADVEEQDRIDEKTLDRTAKMLKSNTCVNELIITRGSKGIDLYSAGNGYLHVPTKEIKVIDITGAGDTTLAAIVAASCAGANTYDAVRIGNFAGRLAVQKPGTATIDQHELIKEIENDTR